MALSDEAIPMIASEGLERAAELFRRQQRRGQTPGGVMVVRQRGQIVLTEAVGVARASDTQPLTVDTTFQVMSVSKAVVAFAVAVLEDLGLVEVTAPVARVWPAFGANGKDQVTILDVLTHRSGLVAEQLVNDPERWRDWNGVTEALAAARPDYPRGTIAYESNAVAWRAINGWVARTSAWAACAWPTDSKP